MYQECKVCKSSNICSTAVQPGSIMCQMNKLLSGQTKEELEREALSKSHNERMGLKEQGRCETWERLSEEKVLNALQKQTPKKTITKISDKDIKIGRVAFRAGTKVHYCPECHKPVTGANIFCSICGQALIW